MIREMTEHQTYPCPACGFIVFDEPPGSYSICPICGWEDDHVQLAHPTLRGGANQESLYEHQQIWGVQISLSIKSYKGYCRDNCWRPLQLEEANRLSNRPETGIEYFQASAEDSSGYYWRDGKSPECGSC